MVQEVLGLCALPSGIEADEPMVDQKRRTLNSMGRDEFEDRKSQKKMLEDRGALFH